MQRLIAIAALMLAASAAPAEPLPVPAAVQTDQVREMQQRITDLEMQVRELQIERAAREMADDEEIERLRLKATNVGGNSSEP